MLLKVVFMLMEYKTRAFVPYWETMFKWGDAKGARSVVVELKLFPCHTERCQVDGLCHNHTLRAYYITSAEKISHKLKCFSCRKHANMSSCTAWAWDVPDRVRLWGLSICRCSCETENTRVSPLACAELRESQPATHAHMLTEMNSVLSWALHWHSAFTDALVNSVNINLLVNRAACSYHYLICVHLLNLLCGIVHVPQCFHEGVS